MLYKQLIVILLLPIFVFGLETSKVEIPLPKQDDKSIKIPSMNLKEGESGILVRNIENNEFIIADIIVESIENKIAIISYTPFNSINQQYMPHPIGTPKEGDKAIFRILYNRALIISPNQDIYKNIIDSNTHIDFIHPDIFASFLANSSYNMPNKNNFSNFCKKFAIGLLFIWDKNTIFKLDCNSLKILEKDNLTNAKKDLTNNIKLPFFTRLGDETLNELFKMKDMKDYSTYYSNLLGLE